MGAYSSLSYCGTKDSSKTKGLLISTYSQSAYPLKQGFKPVEYDD